MMMMMIMAYDMLRVLHWLPIEERVKDKIQEFHVQCEL